MKSFIYLIIDAELFIAPAFFIDNRVIQVVIEIFLQSAC